MRPRRALWVWLALLLGGAWFGLSRVSVVSDMAAFLPREEGLEQALLVDALREGPAARLIIVALGGSDDPKRLAAASHVMAQRLREDARFLRVSNAPASLPDTEQALWFAHRYLLADMPTDSFAVDGLRRELEQRLRELAAPLPSLDKARLPADPQAAFRRVLAGWEDGAAPRLLHGVWFDAGGNQALLLLETRAGGFDLDAQEAARTAILAAADAGIEVQLSGPGILAAASRDVIRTEVQWLSAAATLMMLAILFLAYRSPRLVLLSALPLLAAVVAAVTVTALVFGTLHGITLAFGITLLGVAVDYPLHLFSHLHEREAPVETLRRIWPTLRLGVASSAVGYLAMATSPFPGLAQLALFTVSGLVAAALTVRWVLPSLLLAVTPPHTSYAARGAGRGLWLLPLLMLAAVGYLLVTPRSLLQTELAALSPLPAEWLELDERLRAATGAPDVSRLLLLEGDSMEEVLRRSEMSLESLASLRAAGAISGYRLPSQYLPSAATQYKRRTALPDAAELRARLEAARHGLPFRAALFEPFVHDVAASTVMQPLSPQDVADTLPGQRLASLLRPHGERWLGLVPLYAVQDEAVLAQWAAQSSLPVRYINLRQMADGMVLRFLGGAGVYLLLGMALILVLLAVGLRDGARLLRVMLPVLAALALTAALLHGFGTSLSLFHLVALLLVLGLGIDYGLFFSRRSAAAESARTGHAVTVCAISTASVFAILALSQIPVLHAIGSTVALGVVLSYGFARLVRMD
ncbi:MAG: MMPL family transporter [Pseudomonadota bacterium]